MGVMLCTSQEKVSKKSFVGSLATGSFSCSVQIGVVSRTSALHSLLQRSKALGALVKAAPFVEVKTQLALGAEVFTEAGLAVLYPAPWRKRERKKERKRGEIRV